MRALFLTQYPRVAPSPRYRVFQMLPYLESHGVDCTVDPLLTDEEFRRSRRAGDLAWKSRVMLGALKRRLKAAAAVDQYDVVYILKRTFPYGPPIVDQRIRRAGVPMVFDFDDAIQVGQASVSHRLLDTLRFKHGIASTIAMVDQVMAPNNYLADFARQYNDNVEIVEEAEDTERLTPRGPHHDSQRIVIGWVGSPSTVQWIRLIEPALREVCRRHPGVVIRIIGGQYDVDGLPIEHVPWSLERENENFQALDIGIMPLPLDEWSKGKCGCKLRQYMATGVPGVATRIGYNCRLVEEGVTGFLADKTEEWITALEQLVTDAGLRNRIADAARKSVVERFSIPVIGPQMLDVLQRTASLGIRRSA